MRSKANRKKSAVRIHVVCSNLRLIILGHNSLVVLSHTLWHDLKDIEPWSLSSERWSLFHKPCHVLLVRDQSDIWMAEKHHRCASQWKASLKVVSRQVNGADCLIRYERWAREAWAFIVACNLKGKAENSQKSNTDEKSSPKWSFLGSVLIKGHQ